MQPYFLPYIGYFQLISAVDKWIVFDIVQYKRHHWINRNRILHPKSGWQYIVVPLKNHSRETLIKDIDIANEQKWKDKIVAQLIHYKKKAPFYKETLAFLYECLNIDEVSLSKLNTIVLQKTCQRLGVNFDYIVFSETDLEIDDITQPDEWALKISEKLGAEEYINPYGGRDFFNPEKYREKGIKLKFLNPKNIQYDQKSNDFIPNLSMIDVLMWNSKEEITNMLYEFDLTP